MLKNLVRRAVRSTGFDLARHQTPEGQNFNHLLAAKALLQGAPEGLAQRYIAFCAANLHLSHSQLFQDLLVAFVHDGRQDGFFVEFGAADGVYLSNSLYLEQLGWRGIVAEPARNWQAALARNRTCVIEPRCVWTMSGETLMFNETLEPELSTILKYSTGDGHANSRAGGEQYPVTTVSLNDMLREADAPEIIDYMSIDTEGSELAILQAFDFSAHKIMVLSVEHNFKTADRSALYKLLTAQGLDRVLPELSRFDDWYVRRELLAKLQCA
jgi:FkbM family methyltransferase